jgi:hypothetical protein
MLKEKTNLSRVAYISDFIRQACLAASCHCVCPIMTFKLIPFVHEVQVGSNMTGTSAACLHTNQSRSYLNHLVYLVHKERFVFTGHYAVLQGEPRNVAGVRRLD